ncbi:hypothetical protein BJY04DRAFT_213469 [Aspergillus karnatakaensis]|uniref:HNH endonuclease signature motif containing protein n=1 Tax=Aspergillus karnatakaensis TaxID=1810916 RepID=UPI003CCDA6D9
MSDHRDPERAAANSPSSPLKAQPDPQDRRTVSTASKFSTLSTQSTVSEFLEDRINALQSEIDVIRHYRDELGHKRAAQLLTSDEFLKELEPFLHKFHQNNEELKIIKRQAHTLATDIEDEVDVKRARVDEPDEGLIERAYTSTITTRVMSMTGKQTKQNFDSSRWRKAVEDYYGAAHPGNSADDPNHSTWCHVLGMYLPSKEVKAAHLVPKGLSHEETSYLFGSDHVSRYNPLLGITLSSSVESRLDKGQIIIVPMPGELTAPSRWRVLVLDESELKNGARKIFLNNGKAKIVRFEDIDGKELTFLTDNRPARRYLYFRFIISYLAAKKAGSRLVDSKVDATKFWPTMGRYLRKSTLVTLARCVSGCDLPPSLVDGKTFDSDVADEIKAGDDAGMTLALDLRGALTRTLGKAEEESADEELSDEE